MRSFLSFLPTPQGDHSAAAAAEPLAHLRASDVEVSHLGRYIGIVVLIASAAMVSTWSRVGLIEVSAALGAAESRLEAAQADHARLALEHATLTDPVRLEALSSSHGLAGQVSVVDLETQP